MSNLTNMVQRLKKERDQLQRRRRIEQFDEALRALAGHGGARRQGSGHPTGKRKTMSAAGRQRIAAAQRARWAKWKAARRVK